MNINFVITNYNSTLGILLYWVPVSICVFGYTVRTAKNFMKDTKKRDEVIELKSGTYYPTDTIGTLIGRGVASIVPVVNLWAALFDISPVLFKGFFKWFDKVFNQPLVPDTTRRK